MRAAFFPRVLLTLLVAGAWHSPVAARADEAPAAPLVPSLAPLLSRTAVHAEQFEEMKKRGSYTLHGRMEELDRSGHVDGTKEMVLRVIATPTKKTTELVQYLEDGTDKTEEARQKEAKRKAEPPKAEKKPKMSDFRLPFLAAEQGRYFFSIVGRDLQRNQTRIAFQPKVPAEDAFHGSAWVDEASGEILTLGFSPSKYPTFIDQLDVTVRFDLMTPLGRAPSSFTFDARGSFLLIRKHYRGTATLSDARLGF